MHTYMFFWSPEGRMICTIVAANITKAKREFKASYPQYAKYMGEVYWTVDGQRS